MRASVWIVVLLGAVSVAAVVAFTARDAEGPSAAAIVAAQARTAAEARVAARGAATSASAGVRLPDSRDTGTPSSRALARDRGTNSRATSGPAGAMPGVARQGEPGRAEAPAVVDRDLERSVARLGQELDLPALPRTRGSRAEALDDEGYTAEVADVAMVEYLMREALWEQFHAQNKLVPWGFPLNQLRGSLAEQVAGLSIAERNALLALAEERLPQQAPPIMSKHVQYEGGDFEGSASGVDVLE